MKTKLRITKQYEPHNDENWYRGYKFTFFNLIPTFVCISYDFDECKKELLRSIKSTKETVILDFYAEDIK